MFRVSGKLAETIGTFWWSVPKIWRVEKCTTFLGHPDTFVKRPNISVLLRKTPNPTQPMDRSNRWPTMSAANTQQRSRRQQISPLCCPWWAAVNAGMRQVRVVYFKRHQQNRKSRIATSPEQDRATAINNNNNNNNSPIISYAPLTRQRHYKGAQTSSKHWQRGDVWDLVLGICDHTDRQTDRKTQKYALIATARHITCSKMHHFINDTIRYEMLFNVRSKANMSQLNLQHGTDN